MLEGTESDWLVKTTSQNWVFLKFITLNYQKQDFIVDREIPQQKKKRLWSGPNIILPHVR